MNIKHIISLGALVVLVMLTGTSCWSAAGYPNDTAIGNRPIEFIMESIPLGPMSLMIQQLDPSALMKLIQSLRIVPEVRQEAVEALQKHINELVRQNNNDVQEALFDAFTNNKPWAIKPLAQAGANVNAITTGGFTALTWSALKDHAAVVSELIQSGANIDATSSNGLTALMAAAQKGRAAVVSELIQSGANIDASNPNNNWTALIFAVNGGHTTVVDQLLHAGANVNAISINGRTALMVAIDNRNREIAALLISHGADFSNLSPSEQQKLEEWGLLD